MSDPIESVEFSDQDVQDLRSIGVTDGDAPEFHPILEVWREVLKPAHAEATQPVTPQWANKILATYQRLAYDDMIEVRDRYFGKLFALEDILKDEIESDEDCLTYTSPEEDVEHNSVHYRNLLQNWQLLFLDWEMNWDCMDPSAAAEIAAIGEVYNIIFGNTGITAFLDNIRFEFGEADQAELARLLQERKDGQ
jgi:hypothetical protein